MTPDDQKVAGIGCGIVLLIGVVAAVLLLPTHAVTVTVSAQDWRREIRVENYIPRRYTDWIESVPSDAYDQSSYRAIRRYDRIQTGENCVNTGSGLNRTRICTPTYMSIPVYGTKVDYTADRWGYERSQVVTGDDRATPFYWPTLDFTPCATINCEREGTHDELYQVYFKDGETTFPCPVSPDLWGEYRPGDAYQIQMGLFVHTPRCETIKEK